MIHWFIWNPLTKTFIEVCSCESSFYWIFDKFKDFLRSIFSVFLFKVAMVAIISIPNSSFSSTNWGVVGLQSWVSFNLSLTKVCASLVDWIRSLFSGSSIILKLSLILFSAISFLIVSFTNDKSIFGDEVLDIWFKIFQQWDSFF